MIWQISWQDCLAVMAVVWALWYLGHRAMGVVRRDTVTGCGTCAGCGGGAKRTDMSRRGYVPVESLLESAGKKR
jgi:hypothetical protein